MSVHVCYLLSSFELVTAPPVSSSLWFRAVFFLIRSSFYIIMSKVVLSVAVAIILSLFSPCDAARKPSPPPPSPYPPVPIIPTCGIFVQFSLVKGNFTSSQLKNKNVCNKLAALFVAHYTTPFTWSCQTLTSRTIVIQAYPQIQQQAKAITSFQTLFNRNIDAQAIMQSIGGSCGDTLALSAR